MSIRNTLIFMKEALFISSRLRFDGCQLRIILPTDRSRFAAGCDGYKAHWRYCIFYDIMAPMIKRAFEAMSILN
jgi:hypothetical protein